MTSPSFTLSEVIALTCDMNHGEVCGAAVLAAVDRAIESRREPGDPPAPRMTGLVVRRYGLPEWWNNGENLLLSAPDAQLELANGLGFQPVTGNLGVVGTGVRVRWLAFPGVGGLIAIGDGAELAFSDVAASNGGAVLIGEGTTARSFARVDSRNGGRSGGVGRLGRLGRRHQRPPPKRPRHPKTTVLARDRRALAQVWITAAPPDDVSLSWAPLAAAQRCFRTR